MMRILYRRSDILIEDLELYAVDAERAIAWNDLVGSGSGVNLTMLWRGVAMPGLDKARISSWALDREDAASFGPRVRGEHIPFADVLGILRVDGLTEYVVVGHPETEPDRVKFEVDDDDQYGEPQIGDMGILG